MNGRKRTQILMVEDELEICRIIKESLELEGYDVDIANSGDVALEKLRRKTFQVVFIDIKLEGEITGIDLVKQMRGLNHLPRIYIASALPKGELENILVENNIADIVHNILQKPEEVTPSYLARLLKNL